MNLPIIIGTRGSDLALWQANFTKNELERKGIKAEIKIIKTKGDATQQWNLSFDKMEGKGFFTKELEEALLAKEIDLAVHSCKDLPTDFPEGLTIAAYSKRANPFDVLLIKKDKVDASKLLKLKENAKVGTSSARRKSQLLALRPDINIQDLRGNVPSRINKLRNEDYDAITLASAGVERLNIDLSEFEIIPLRSTMFIPAPAQGVLAFQIREDDVKLKEICAYLNDKNSSTISAIERQLLHDFDGGCQMPLGVYAEKINQEFHVWIAQAAAWNTFPKRQHLILKEIILEDVEQWKTMSKTIVENFKSKSIPSVFVSSHLEPTNYLRKALEDQQIPLTHQSYISFTPIEFSFPKDANWIFFSSKNGVKYFFDACFDEIKNGQYKLAAVNHGTAQAIYTLGLNVDFIGQGNDLNLIAQQFDAMANGKIVFIQAKNSNRSIQKGIQKNKNTETLVVYENNPVPNIEQRKEQILIFTSPMNVEAYFSKFQIESFQSVISIGSSTSKKLDAFAVKNYKTAYEPSWWSILDEL
ncbi:MAG: hydroxymethylbilane synthase [Bacteroidetes bacterium]|nr:hydroxymethylbilane synthase [Bacteroidota bacterium]